jgi:hypothetical protein
MARITDQATLTGMRGKRIRFMKGKYGGKQRTEGTGFGWRDKTPRRDLAVMVWVIVDMGLGVFKHTQVKRANIRTIDENEPRSFDHALLQQYPEIEDSLESLAQLLARVRGLDFKIDGVMMMDFYGKFLDAQQKQGKFSRDNWLVVEFQKKKR